MEARSSKIELLHFSRYYIRIAKHTILVSASSVMESALPLKASMPHHS